MAVMEACLEFNKDDVNGSQMIPAKKRGGNYDGETWFVGS